MELKKITSRNNEYIKELTKLSNKKYRETSGMFAFEGHKLLEEALISGITLKAVLVTKHALESYSMIKSLLFKGIDFDLIEVTDEVYDKISFEKSPEGIFCVAEVLDKYHIFNIIYKCSDFSLKTVILDGIRDPGNLGTILRTASAFGIDTVIMSHDCADIYNSKTIRASMGAVFRIKTVSVKDLPGTVLNMRENGYKVYSAALIPSSISLTDLEIDTKTVMIIGNEGSGIRNEVISSSSGSVIIPMQNGTESLNAASAATVILWEMYRQQN